MWAGGAFRNWLSRLGETGLCALGTGIGQGVWVVGLRQASSGVVAAESVQVTPVLCGRLIPLALFGRYGPLLSGGLPLGIAAYAGLPVFVGAGGAAGLARDGLFAAVPALAELLGSLPFFLGESRQYSFRSGFWLLARSYSRRVGATFCLEASLSSGDLRWFEGVVLH